MFAQKLPRYDVFRQVIERTIKDNKYTPDIMELEQHEFQLFFAYDDLQIGKKRHKLIEDCAYCCTAFTQKYFQYFTSPANPDMRPIAMETPLTEPLVCYLPKPGRIAGQLLLIKTDQFKKLDIDMMNGVSFVRERTRLIVPFREIRTFPTCDVTGRDLPRVLLGKEDMTYLDNEQVYIIRAWMYRGVPAFWDDIIDAGYNFQSMPIFEPKHRRYLKRYYKYVGQ